MMNLQKATGVVFAVALFAFSLSTSPALSSEPFEITKSGVMRYLELEGGCWQLATLGGQYYEPVFGSEDLYKDGKKVVVRGIARPGLISICMVGTMLIVTESFFEPCGTFVVPTGNLEGAILALIPILIPGLLVLILKRKYR